MFKVFVLILFIAFEKFENKYLQNYHFIFLHAKLNVSNDAYIITKYL